MSEKLLKYLIYITGVLCIYAFVAIRFEPLFNAVLKEDVVDGYWDKTKYGELYYFSMIRHFREKGLPPAKPKFEYSPMQASVDDCDILALGDSFFEFSRHKQFPQKLAEDFAKKVHYVNNDHPLDYLAMKGYHGTKPKLVLFERVERYIPLAFEKPQEIPQNPQVKEEKGFQPLLFLQDKLFYDPSEELYDAMLKRSYLTTDLFSLFATLKFDLFGNISSLTPAYKKDGANSWLFYHDQVNGTKTSFYYPFTDQQIDTICDNMAALEKTLLNDYNMQLLYLPLPAKYTIYHGLINDDAYNEFLPRLYEGLNRRGVKFVRVYEDFMQSDTVLYYHTDSHWNQRGIDIAYKKTIDYIRSDPDLRPLLFNEPNGP